MKNEYRKATDREIKKFVEYDFTKIFKTKSFSLKKQDMWTGWFDNWGDARITIREALKIYSYLNEEGKKYFYKLLLIKAQKDAIDYADIEIPINSII